MLIGNLTKDPELRYTPQGTAVATFTLATNRSWTTDTGEKKEEAEFTRCVAWTKLAEICGQYLKKGLKIFVEGRLQTRSFTGQDNLQHYITEVVVSDMMILTPKGPDSGEAEKAEAAPVSPVEKPEKIEEKTEQVNVEDIPF